MRPDVVTPFGGRWPLGGFWGPSAVPPSNPHFTLQQQGRYDDMSPLDRSLTHLWDNNTGGFLRQFVNDRLLQDGVHARARDAYDARYNQASINGSLVHTMLPDPDAKIDLARQMLNGLKPTLRPASPLLPETPASAKWEMTIPATANVFIHQDGRVTAQLQQSPDELANRFLQMARYPETTFAIQRFW